MATYSLNNDLSMFVDIMYYDFVLYKLVEFYRNGTLQDSKDEYFEIVRILMKKFKNNEIVLDSQISLKILYIKFKQHMASEKCRDMGHADTFCCSSHICSLLRKGYNSLIRLKEEHASLADQKIYKDMLTLLASLIGIYFREKGKHEGNKSLMTSVSLFLKNHNVEITKIEDFNRLKTSLCIKLNVRNDREFEKRMFMAIDSMLERTFRMLNEPFLYSLTVEKVTNMFRKHSKVFKEDKEIIKLNAKAIFKPETCGEKVEWEDK